MIEKHICDELKQECKRLQYFESMYRQRTLQLEKENEELKQSWASTLREFEKGTKKIRKLTKENEQLKEQIREFENLVLSEYYGR